MSNVKDNYFFFIGIVIIINQGEHFACRFRKSLAQIVILQWHGIKADVKVYINQSDNWRTGYPCWPIFNFLKRSEDRSGD